jgi:DeoR family fructose operon transcriptional repressor
MIRIPDIVTALQPLVGWRQSYNPAEAIDTELLQSESGLFFQDAHPLITLNNVAAIMPDDFIYIDSGTATAAMIPFITEHSAVYVTNAVAHGLELARRGFRVNLIGGEIRTPTEAIVGSAACEELRSYNFTKCFMGTNGADPDTGFSTPDIGEAVIKGRAMAQSRQRYILCTAEKFQIVSPVRFADFADATIITDHCPDSWYEQQRNVVVAP